MEIWASSPRGWSGVVWAAVVFVVAAAFYFVTSLVAISENLHVANEDSVMRCHARGISRNVKYAKHLLIKKI